MSNSVRNIKSYAFSNCSNLSNIIFNGTINEWNNITKASDWKNNSNIQKIRNKTQKIQAINCA